MSGHIVFFTGSKSNAISVLGGYIVKDLQNGIVGCLCGRRLLLP